MYRSPEPDGKPTLLQGTSAICPGPTTGLGPPGLRIDDASQSWVPRNWLSWWGCPVPLSGAQPLVVQSVSTDGSGERQDVDSGGWMGVMAGVRSGLQLFYRALCWYVIMLSP